MAVADIIDFGNGVVASVRPAPNMMAIIGHSGCEAPEIEIEIAEHGVLEGAMVGAARPMARRLTFEIHTGGRADREKMRRAFAGRTLLLTGSNANGVVWRIPVTCDAFNSPASPARRSKYISFTVSLVSPWAYPRGSRVTFGGTTAGDTVTTAETIIDGPTDPNTATPTALPLYAPSNNSWGQQIALANNASLKSFSLYISRPSDGSPGTFRPMVFLQTGGVWVSVYAGAPVSLPVRTALTGNPRTTVPIDHKNTSGASQNLIIAAFDVTADAQAPMAAVGNARRLQSGSWNAFSSGGDSAFRLRYTVATPSATSTVCPVVYEGDAPAPARVLIKPSSATSSLTVTAKDTGGATVSETRMTGSVSAGSIVTIGDDEAERSLLVGSTNRLAWWDMASDWPLVTPQTALFETSALGNIEVSFEPRYMGLI